MFMNERDCTKLIGRRRPVDLGKYTIDEFLEWNQERFRETRADQTRIAFPDDLEQAHSYGYFLVSYEWMAQWRRFLQGDLSYPPREIDNIALKAKIERRRSHRGNPASDEDLGLQDKKDFYTLSVNFFRFFYDTYGCN